MTRWADESADTACAGADVHLEMVRSARLDRLALGGWSRLSLTSRLMLAVMGFDLAFSLLVALSFLALVHPETTAMRSLAVSRIVLLDLFRYGLIVLVFPLAVRPIERALVVGEGSTRFREVVAAGRRAAVRASASLAAIVASAWALQYPAVAVLLRSRPEWRSGPELEPVSLLMGLATFLGALSLFYVVIEAILAPVAGALTVRLGGNPSGEGSLFPLPLPARLAILALCLGTTPAAWLAAFAIANEADRHESTFRYATNMALYSGVALLWVLLFAGYLVFVVARPIRRISRAVGQLALRGFESRVERVPVTSADEVGSLAAAVNSMLATLERRAGQQRKAMEERDILLTESESHRRLLEAVIDSLPAAVSVLAGPEFRLTIGNPANEKLAPGGQVLGRPIFDLWPEIEPLARPLYERIMATGETIVRTEDRLTRRGPDGSFIEEWYDATLKRVPIPDGSQGILIVAVDVTDKVRARNRLEHLAEEAQRRASELQAVMDNMLDAVYVVDRHGIFTMVNRAAMKLAGARNPEECLVSVEVLARRLNLRDPRGQPLLRERMAIVRALAGEQVQVAKLMATSTVDGSTHHIQLSAAPIKSAAGEVDGAVAVVRDVTEKEEFERMKDEFMATAAHELKTPVTIIKTGAQLLERSGSSLSLRERQLLGSIDRGASRIARIVRDLVDLSVVRLGRMELMRERRLPLERLLKDAAEAAGGEAGLDALSFRVDRRLLVSGDRLRLIQLFTTLLDNAMRYSSPGGEIEVTAAVDGGDAIIAVKDRGIGIPRSRQARLFEPLYRAHANTSHDRGGLGVGLFIAREIARNHGGDVWFESEEGQGSTFFVRLPEVELRSRGEAEPNRSPGMDLDGGR